MASFCAAQEGRPAGFWRSLEGELNQIALRRTSLGETVWGVSALASDGILVRGLAASGRFLHEPLVEFWNAARLAVIGTVSVPPRKIY